MRAYVTTQFTDEEGITHTVGEEIEVPRRTPEEKQGFERMETWGLISTVAPALGDQPQG